MESGYIFTASIICIPYNYIYVNGDFQKTKHPQCVQGVRYRHFCAMYVRCRNTWLAVWTWKVSCISLSNFICSVICIINTIRHNLRILSSRF